MIKFTYLFRRTLVRRIFLALLLAMSLSWAVVMYKQNEGGDQSSAEIARIMGTSLLKILGTTDDALNAETIISTASQLAGNEIQSDMFRGKLLFRLEDKNGNVLFLTPDGINAELHKSVSGSSSQKIHDIQLESFKGETRNWILTVSLRDPTLWDTIQLLFLDITNAILTIFFLVLIAIWFAVVRGLKPLKQLSDQLANKHENDLRPLDIDTKYEELKPVAQAINALLNQLKNKIERERAFVQNAAHELRTPMAVISAQAHVLALAVEATDRVEAEVRLDHAIARASRLIQQMLKLAHVDGDRPLAGEFIDLAQLVRQELAWAAPFTLTKNIDLSLEAPDSLSSWTERETFLSILNNLVDNAIRYTQTRGQIVIELKSRNNEIILTVTDNGPGIAEHDQKLVFERFHRVIGQDVAGSGLGLSIVRQASERLGGSVRVGAGLNGTGCHFLVTFPDSPGPAASLT